MKIVIMAWNGELHYAKKIIFVVWIISLKEATRYAMPTLIILAVIFIEGLIMKYSRNVLQIRDVSNSRYSKVFHVTCSIG